ncbi:unnamed protein product, partial [Chrysoparadoxa australica]
MQTCRRVAVRILVTSWFLSFLYACHLSCSGHGTCNQWDQCTCYTGFKGADCSRRSCPTGKAWSDIAT